MNKTVLVLMNNATNHPISGEKDGVPQLYPLGQVRLAVGSHAVSALRAEEVGLYRFTAEGLKLVSQHKLGTHAKFEWQVPYHSFVAGALRGTLQEGVYSSSLRPDKAAGAKGYPATAVAEHLVPAENEVLPMVGRVFEEAQENSKEVNVSTFVFSKLLSSSVYQAIHQSALDKEEAKTLFFKFQRFLDLIKEGSLDGCGEHVKAFSDAMTEIGAPGTRGLMEGLQWLVITKQEERDAANIHVLPYPIGQSVEGGMFDVISSSPVWVLHRTCSFLEKAEPRKGPQKFISSAFSSLDPYCGFKKLAGQPELDELFARD
jgi:hypothetical protein